MTDTSYDVTLSRGESGAWVGRCDAVRGNTQAATVRGALDGLRDVIALVDELEPGEVQFGSIEIDDDVQGASEVLAEAVADRRALTDAETTARASTLRAVRGLTDAGITRRDVGALLGISHQRVDQLLAN